MKKEEVQSIAFMTIAHAGSAFDLFYKAIDEAEDKKYSEAENLLSEGKKELNEAHRAQANLLSAEANQEEIPFSIIMTHAQDHLTMAIFMQRMSEKMIRMYKKMEENF